MTKSNQTFILVLEENSIKKLYKVICPEDFHNIHDNNIFPNEYINVSNQEQEILEEILSHNLKPHSPINLTHKSRLFLKNFV